MKLLSVIKWILNCWNMTIVPLGSFGADFELINRNEFDRSLNELDLDRALALIDDQLVGWGEITIEKATR
ncbi:MAG: hypothetical protein H8E49_02940 [Gammaproteobacteria bacterium]|nr:hypothetical protein [Gammaproteobacteria bacterium]